jgi:alkylation response protein AidB-like acyl-CoA dehydrogenase
MGWLETLPDYLVSRVAEHGRRRAAEMREVARTLEDVKLEPMMAQATAARQDWLIDAMAAAGCAYPRQGPLSWRALADALEAPRQAAKAASFAAGNAADVRKSAAGDFCR